MEAFSDGVLAIIITIMVLGLRVPHGTTFSSLRSVLPALLGYVLSFVNLGIYWNNHHHLLKTVERVTGGVLWANLNLLFWLSLMPFTTSWMTQSRFAPLPVAVYGFDLLLSGVAYYVLTRTIIAANGPSSVLATAVGRDAKGVLSMVIYAVAIPLTILSRWIAVSLYVVVAIMWLVPDRRVQSLLEQRSAQAGNAA
jgi:uncharacterized membrane protein